MMQLPRNQTCHGRSINAVVAILLTIFVIEAITRGRLRSPLSPNSGLTQTTFGSMSPFESKFNGIFYRDVPTSHVLEVKDLASVGPIWIERRTGFFILPWNWAWRFNQDAWIVCIKIVHKDEVGMQEEFVPKLDPLPIDYSGNASCTRGREQCFYYQYEHCLPLVLKVELERSDGSRIKIVEDVHLD
jgi:hypothetical protein